MTWLSLATVDKRDFAPRDVYGWHEAIWDVFPWRDEDKRRDLGFLFRVDDQRQAFRVHVLSAASPTPPAWGVWQSKEVAETFLDHDRYRFQLKANPTMRRAEDGRRLGLFKEDLLRSWMARKAESNGFSVDDNTLVVGAPIEERFWHRKTGAMGKYIAVDFQGLLRVTDREAFKKAFAAGIGSAKGFGFGLLMVSPIRDQDSFCGAALSESVLAKDWQSREDNEAWKNL